MRGSIGLLCLLVSLSAAAQRDFSKVEVKTEPLREGLHLLTGAGGNVVVSVGEDGAFLVDDQFAPLSHRIQTAVAELGAGPVRFVINTHWHGDHTGGNEPLAANGAIIVAHENVRQRMSTPQFQAFFDRHTEPAATQALPVVTFNDSVSLHLNGEQVRVVHVPRAHTDTDAIVHFVGANIIHVGDTLFASSYPYIDVSTGGTVDGYLAALEHVESLADDDTIIVPGHGPLRNRSQLAAYRMMLQDIRDRVAALKRQGLDLPAVIEAAPDAAYRDTYRGWIKPEDLIGFIYSTL